MKQFESLPNKVDLGLIPDGVWRWVPLAFLDDDVKYVSLEVHNPGAADYAVYLWGYNTFQPANVMYFEQPPTSYSTHICKVGGGPHVINCNLPVGSEIVVSAIGQWGGDAVKYFASYIRAPGWTEETGGTWREVDLTPYLPVEDRGNVEAVICLLNEDSLTGGKADARAVGSTWEITSPRWGSGIETVVKVDDDNLVEVYESIETPKLDPAYADGQVYLIGYILRDKISDGTGNLYQYKAIAEPVSDGDIAAGAWTEYAVSGVTSPYVDVVYWRAQMDGAGIAVPFYARDIGSTDSALSVTPNRRCTPGFVLTVDASKEVEHYFQLSGANADTDSWVFGYLLLPLPEQATNPDPADAETDVVVTKTLSWTAGLGAVSHNVYFGTDPSPDAGEFQGNQAGTTFDPGTLVANVTYYWRIDEVNLQGVTTGVVWSFTARPACNWFDEPSPDPVWLSSEAGQDWLASEAGQDWLTAESGQDWAGATSGAGWYKKEC
jgi:hypothetical protein